MTDTQRGRADVILPIIERLTHPASRHLVKPETKLSALGMCPFDRAYTLPLEIEEVIGIEISDATIDGWRTVSDVLGSVA